MAPEDRVFGLLAGVAGSLAEVGWGADGAAVVEIVGGLLGISADEAALLLEQPVVRRLRPCHVLLVGIALGRQAAGADELERRMEAT